MWGGMCGERDGVGRDVWGGIWGGMWGGIGGMWGGVWGEGAAVSGCREMLWGVCRDEFGMW
jgi:hypothetical protein